MISFPSTLGLPPKLRVLLSITSPSPEPLDTLGYLVVAVTDKHSLDPLLGWGKGVLGGTGSIVGHLGGWLLIVLVIKFYIAQRIYRGWADIS